MYDTLVYVWDSLLPNLTDCQNQWIYGATRVIPVKAISCFPLFTSWLREFNLLLFPKQLLSRFRCYGLKFEAVLFRKLIVGGHVDSTSVQATSHMFGFWSLLGFRILFWLFPCFWPLFAELLNEKH